MIHGVDVSKWQGTINWAVLKTQAQFVIIRASYAGSAGGVYPDEKIAANWPGSRGLLPRGAYHFYRPDVPWKPQVDALFKALGGDLGELPLSIDVEAPSSPWTEFQRVDLRSTLTEVTQRSGRVPFIYTGNWYWPAYVGSEEWAANYPLWLGEYVAQNKLIIPRPWEGYTIWQYTSSGKGSVYGVESATIDLNRFDGSSDEWAALIGGNPMATVRVKSGSISYDLPLPITIEEVGPLPVANWQAEFFNNKTLTAPVVFSTTYPDLDRSWGTGGPGGSVTPDNFSGRFTRVYTLAAGAWEWTVRSDDGFRLKVDGTVVPGLDGWIEQSAASKTYKGHVTLAAGTHTVVVEYFENGGLAELHVSEPAPFQ